MLMADDFWMNASGQIIVNGSGQPIDCVDPPCGDVATPCDELCIDASVPFSFALVAGSTPNVTGNIVYSPTAHNGVDPGWAYNPDADPLGDYLVCTGSISLTVRSIIFWCDGAGWQTELVVVFNGITDSYSTQGGTLDPVIMTSASNPRVYMTRTAAPVSVCDLTGKLRLDFTVKV